MPLLEHNKLIGEYWEEVKSKYPQLDFDKFYLICRAPFNYIREQIRDKSLPIIMIKYLGKFRVYPGRIKEFINISTRKKIIGDISEEEWIKQKEYLLDRLKHIERYDSLLYNDDEGPDFID